MPQILKQQTKKVEESYEIDFADEEPGKSWFPSFKGIKEKVTKAQAYIRGYLTRKEYNLKKKPKYKMLTKMARRLKDGHIYNVFLMSKPQE